MRKIFITILLITLTLSGVFYMLFLPVTNNKPLKTSGALKALDFWSLQRAYPGRTIPPEGHYKAFEYSKQNFSRASDNITDPWDQIGPHNIGGRTISIAFNPQNGNTIYAGSASGGIWRSYTGGAGVVAWHQISTGYPVLGVGAIAIPSNDTNTIYIGTGEVYGYQNSIGGITIRTTRGSYGIGILKSTDHGLTWTKSLDWTYNQERGIQVIKINPQNPNTVWAGTTEGVYVSYNAGANWIQKHDVIMGTDMVINHLDTNKMVIACGNLNSPGNGIYRSADAGNSWTRITAGLPSNYGGKALLSIYQSSPNIIYSSIGNGAISGAGTWLVRSTNDGITWTTVNNDDYATYQGWFSHVVGVHPTDQNKIYTAGVDIFTSVNGGTNLEQKTSWFLWFLERPPVGGPEGPSDYSHADHHAIAFHPSNPDIVYFGNDGGVFRTTDGGNTFEGCNGSYQTTQFYNGFSVAATDSLYSIGGMQDNATAFYDGDLAWYRVIGGDGCWTAINTRSKDTVYGSSQNLSIRRSTNGGFNFTGISVPGGGLTGFVATYVLAPSNPQIMYAGRSVVYRSTNAGNTWTATNSGASLDGNPALCLNVSPLNPNLVYATTAPVVPPAKVFRTTNGGSTWTNITGILPDRYMVDIVADPVTESNVYITLSGFGTSHVYKSTDYGNTWNDINNGLPDVPASSIAVDPLNNNIIYTGNDIGVYYSTNGGNSWNIFQDGMPDASIVMDLKVSVMNRKIRAATHGNGVFERKMIDPSLSVGNNNTFVGDYRLYQNYPNPFNPATKIKFDIRKSGNVKLIVYDITGKVSMSVLNEFKSAGSYEIEFNASMLASGIYFYRIEAGDFIDVKKMIYVR
jgi:photosystem II stability/assembly factor-like uncharacterized protein